MCLQACRYQRQAQHILQQAELIHQSLDAGWVAIDEEQAVEVCEPVVHPLCSSELAIEL